MTRDRIEEWSEGRIKVALLLERERRRYVVEWFRGGKARRKVFSAAKHRTLTIAKRAARTYAEELFAARCAVPSDRPATMASLFAKYVEAMEDGWRSATRTSTIARWRLWEAFIKPGSDPDSVTADDLDRFHRELRRREKPMSPNQVRQVFALLRAVYRKGIQRKWTTNTDPITYGPRIAKDEAIRGRNEPAEYHPDEWRKLLAVVNGREASWWRLGVALVLEGVQGQRIQAIRHLRVQDVDLEAGVIRWPAEYQKQGRPLEQPLLSAARAAVELALTWRAADGYRGPWLLYAPGRGNVVDPMAGPVSYQTLHSALLKAEKVAGVAHLPYRASHGLRRMAAENVYGATGDLLEAAAWIGDRDVKQLKAYLKRQDERMASAAEAAEKATEGASIVPDIVPAKTTPSGSGVVAGVGESHWSDLNRRPQPFDGTSSGSDSHNHAGLRVTPGSGDSRSAPESDPPIVPNTVPDSGAGSSAGGES